jgi:SAM-dependent methyltransferase
MTFRGEQEKIWGKSGSYKFYWSWGRGIHRSKWFAHFLKHYQFSSIFEVGCNSGRNIKYILEEFDVKAGGLDINNAAVIEAQKLVPKAKFTCESAYDMDTSEKYDIIFTMGTMIHIPPGGIQKVVENCINKANKYIIHMEQIGRDVIINAPKKMRPTSKIKKKFRWAPNLPRIYSKRGFKLEVKPMQGRCVGRDLTHIVVVDLNKKRKATK